ncbi:helix-turn-helix domain-containing protein [Thermodesulfobacteriota bacterium]
MIEESEIGKKIKKFRKTKGITLQELGRKTGLTKGYLSKIENSDKAPPISTLITVAKALNLSISDVFGVTEGKSHITIVKKNERPFIARNGSTFGYAYQALAHKFPNKCMEPFLLTLPVKPKQNALFQHKGEELLFVLGGTMRFVYGEEEFLVEEGDCIYFDASIAHYGVSQKGKEVKCLMVIYTPE